MKVRNKTHVEARANVARAFGHPSRLHILEALTHGERCVCELTTLLGADQSTVSKHLAVLKQIGLLEDRKQGTSVFYRLRPVPLDGLWQCLDAVLEARLADHLAAVQKV